MALIAATLSASAPFAFIYVKISRISPANAQFSIPFLYVGNGLGLFSSFLDSFLIASSTSLIAFSTRSNCWLALSCVVSWSSATFSVSVTKAANRSFTFLSVSFESLSLSSATFFRNAVTSAFSFASSLAAFSFLLAESEFGLLPSEFESVSFFPAVKVLLVACESSPSAGVVGCGTVVAVGVGVTCAAAVAAADASGVPLSLDESPPPPATL